MPTFHTEMIVAAPIDKVWARFQDVRHFLAALTPPNQDLKIVSASPLPPQVGTRVEMTVRGPLGRVRWVAEYVDFAPPHATITGTEARFVDRQVQGPFKRWQHTHEFEAVNSRTTRCVDHIDYAAPLGSLGWVADLVLIRRTLRTMFAYRAQRMTEVLG